MLYIQVCEMQKSIDVKDFVFVEDVAFIIWDWEWIGEDFDSDDIESATSVPVMDPSDSEDGGSGDATASDSPDCSEVTHTVTFKCIGSTKEQQYQECLKHISQIRSEGGEVLCRVKPEPNNPYDSQAIAFESKVDEAWQVIGYVVREALDEVHETLAAKKILGVSFDWVKYQLYWRAPGWYAGISITRSGKWSPTIMHSQSSKAH